jgi:oxygen-independent coproporphyrinogen-3 oxidase
MLNALRLVEGFAPTLYEARTGLAWAGLTEPLARLRKQGLLEESAGLVRPTALGRRFLNDLMAAFLPE